MIRKIYGVTVGTSISPEALKEKLNINDDGNIPGSGGNVDHVGVEPAEDDIPKIFFGGALQQTKDEAVVPFRYISKTEDFSGYAEIKAQGNSSMGYPKKNQTVKMFKDADCTEKMKVDFKGWGKQNKHCYKANWIDITHARNIVSARLWADMVKSRVNYAELPELLRTTPNQGAMDGFPVKVYADGVYQGRYTLNIPKDKWAFNMDDELEEHCVLCGENYASGCFRVGAIINGSDWSDEIHDTAPTSIKTRWNDVISFVMNSTDEDFRANLGSYFDIPSLIDYHLFGLVSCGLDAYGKNQIYMTYDGQKWIASMYDMDSTWGLWWTGGSFVASDYDRSEYQDFKDGNGNLLYIRLENLFHEELKTRWAELKNGALSIANIINRFERFTDIAPAELVKEDYATTTGGGAFTGIPSQSTNNIQQIRAFALARQAWTDEYVTGLTTEVRIPCSGISLSSYEMEFTSEGKQTLVATVTPADCTDAITWESDNVEIASVVNGVVTAIENGTATITARCGDYSATCIVTVSGIYNGVEAPTDYVYALPAETTFDGVDDYINTEQKLQAESGTYTVLVDFTGVADQVTNGSVLYCKQKASPWPGFELTATSAGYKAEKTIGINMNDTNRHKVVIHKINTSTIWVRTDTFGNGFSYGGGNATGLHEKPLLIGCAVDDALSAYSGYWKGTVHSVQVFKRTLSPEEIDTFLGGSEGADIIVTNGVAWTETAKYKLDNTGIMVGGDQYVTTSKIPVEAGKYYRLKGVPGTVTYFNICFYDENEAYISNKDPGRSYVGGYEFITPENAAFAMLSIHPNEGNSPNTTKVVEVTYAT